MNRYHIETGPDGTHWVSLEPLLQDLEHHRQQAANQPEVRDRFLAVEAFIQALIHEGRQRDWDRQKNEKTPA